MPGAISMTAPGLKHRSDQTRIKGRIVMNIAVHSMQGSRTVLMLLILAAAIFFFANQHNDENFDVRSVTAGEAKTLIDAGAVVIDVRSKERYGQGHIPGAMLVPITVLRAGIPASVAHARDKPLVVYCNDGATTGPEGTHLLNRAGYKNAVNVKAGIEGWTGAGLPVRK
jgi:rhodanese-related sulfurtransferase